VGETHLAITATGLDDPGVAEAVGRYAVGSLAGAVELDGSLSDFLLVGGVDKRAELAAEVAVLVGATNVFLSEQELDFRDRWRNAWIGEITTHALLVVRSRAESACLPGPVRALSQPHTRPKRQGLDSVAIYEESGAPVVAVGETKASAANGSSQLSAACDIYDEIDAGLYGADLRQHLISLRRVLPSPLALQVSDALWRTSRCYLPVILHETAFDPDTDRVRLGRLQPDVRRRRVVVLRFAAFHSFFDRVADTMRSAVEELVV
jgi:hypothetical protein